MKLVKTHILSDAKLYILKLKVTFNVVMYIMFGSKLKVCSCQIDDDEVFIQFNQRSSRYVTVTTELSIHLA